ncbi:DUF3631 domain-containing protein [Brevibacterium spongiae]|uniref:DUF3631 domain-containing protein n=1 Tax=Brevibacterium spongiae TaxID=2909672 RepID=A0ABY5SM25_9MICO|nr:DUF3631 domain-containing protein [Brevibacterium spongiae]UVI35006.1 DUF3631 domain-containing protein [Brevibacterium spongiae]
MTDAYDGSHGLDGSFAADEPRRIGGSVGPVGSLEGSAAATDGGLLDDVRAWFARYVHTMHDSDLDLLTLWTVHTHVVSDLYTTPRLLLDSPVPGSGKTTVLEHLGHLALDPVQAASLSSSALLTRMLADRMRTVLIDEADRSLDPKLDGTAELLAILNSGYKRGGTRPVLTPDKDKGWVAQEMPTFSPVAMAGNNPNLPDDTRSRIIRVLLLPDLEGNVEESDWELIEADAEALKQRIEVWAEYNREEVGGQRPPLPAGVIGRAKERWSPLKRIAVVAGGRWPEIVDELAQADLEQLKQDKEDGMVIDKPAVVLLKHLAIIWGDEPFVATRELVDRLIAHDAEMWGEYSAFGKPLTAQRFGRMLATSYSINSTRQGDSPRGYFRAKLLPVWRRMGITPPERTDGADGTVEPTAEPAPLWGVNPNSDRRAS